MSSNPNLPVPRLVSSILNLSLAALIALPLAAQDDTGATAGSQPGGEEPAAQETAEQTDQADATDQDEEPLRINLAVTVPRGDVNEAQARECVDRADAGSISGEIIVCRRRGESGANSYSGNRTAAQKRYAQETAFKGSPPPPDIFGIPNTGNSIGFGSVPPPALIIDVEALPDAPPGSDADRIARGLPPLGQDDLSEDEIRKRREALGLPPPAFKKKPE